MDEVDATRKRQLQAMVESGDPDNKAAGLLGLQRLKKIERSALSMLLDTEADIARKVRAEQKRNQANAAAPRPQRRDLLRARIVEAMRGQRASGTEFKVVMAAWERDGVLDGLTIKPVTSGKHKDKYLVADDRAGQTKAKPYTWATLKKLHTEAG